MIVVADWNMEPQELATTGLLDLLGVDTVTPRGVQSTCYSGRMLDYALVSRPLLPAAQVSIDPSTPWKAHSPIAIEVSRSPMSIQVRSLVVPSRFDLTVAPNAQGTWTPRGAALPIFVGGFGHRQANVFVLGDSFAESMLVGSTYSAWSEASEHWLLWAYGHSHTGRAQCKGQRQLPELGRAQCKGQRQLPEPGPPARAHEGRGQFLALRWTPLAHWSDSGLAGAVTRRARLWVAIESRLIDYCRLPRAGSQPVIIQSYLCSVASCLEFDLVECSFDDRLGMRLWALRLRDLPSLSPNVLKGIIVEARQQARAADRAHNSSVAARVRAWATDAVLGSCKAAHAYLGKADTGSVLAPAEDRQRPGLLFFDPDVACQARRDQWALLWQRDRNEVFFFSSFLAELRSVAKWQQHRLQPIDDWEAQGAIDRLRNSRGLGCDHWSPQELKALPPNAIAALSCLYRECESLVAIPAQVVLNIMCLLPKPSGGERAIVLQALWLVV